MARLSGMTKPSEELLRRVGLYRDTFGAGANPRWNDELVAQFGEDIVRECAKIARYKETVQPQSNYLRGCKDTSEITVNLILHKFGLKE